MKSKVFLIELIFFIAFNFTAYGMSRVILKPNNIKGNKCYLTQDAFYKLDNGAMVPRVNTIFVIQDDFDLYEDITIPAGCVLEFNGGSLKNGRINTNGCYIKADLYQIFDQVYFNTPNTYYGLFEERDNIYVKILKADSFINKKTNTIIPDKEIVNRRYIYRITDKSTSLLVGNQSVSISLNGQKYTIAEVTSNNDYKLTYDYSRVIGIFNATGEMASGEVDSLNDITFYSISPLSYKSNSRIANKEIHPEWFGARGDNANDDSYAFNTALDLAYFSDSKVVIGHGVYKINDALVIHTHTNLVGSVPTVEHPVQGCFSVNTDVAMLIFDKFNPSGSYNLENFGFRPFSEEYSYNYTGIRIFHSQNHASISNIGFLYPKTGVDIDAIGGVQMLRCEDISVRSLANKGTVAITAKKRLGGWFNANYFRFACVSNSGGVRFEGGRDNTLDGGAGYVESGSDYLINLDREAILIVRGGLYNESGRFAKLRNSSRIKIEGDSYLTGVLDCDETSYVVQTSKNIQSRGNIINNSIVKNDVVLAHYKVFSKEPSLWQETIGNRIVKPLELARNYTVHSYNGRIYTSGKCKIPMGDIDINGKTIALRIISPTSYTSSQRSYPFIINADINGKSMFLSQARSVAQDNMSVLYAPGEVNLGYVERGERYVFIPSKYEEYILQNITTIGISSLMISDIYIIDKDSKAIVGNEALRIMDVMSALDAYVQDNGFLLGYNKGTSIDRPTNLSNADEGFEYFDTTLHKPVYWTGDSSIGDHGWVDAVGRHPNL